MSTVLDDRLILRISGEEKSEILKFLQQVTSNDLLNNSNSLIYTLFLSGNGKFLFDAFVFSDDKFVYLDCINRDREKIVNHIKKYKARLLLKIEEAVYHVYSNLGCEFSVENCAIFDDPRGLGKRIYSNVEISDYKKEANNYHFHRVKNNVPEGSYEMYFEQSFPIYFRMHEICAISLTKGCYLGQEPTNRLYRTGVLRKKVIPFVLDDKNTTLKKGDILDGGVVCSIFDGRFGFVMKEIE